MIVYCFGRLIALIYGIEWPPGPYSIHCLALASFASLPFEIVFLMMKIYEIAGKKKGNR